jgi:hypothetical protein
MSTSTVTPDPDAPSPESLAEDAAPAAAEGGFSLELTQDQKDIRDWVHGFAADVAEGKLPKDVVALTRREEAWR